jgi:hypothetical protein
VSQEGQLQSIWDLKNLLELFSNSNLYCLISSSFSPDSNTVLLWSDTDNNAADFISIVKLLADAGENTMEPIGVEHLSGALGDCGGPFASVFAGRVLPLWFYSFAEEVEVTACRETAGWNDVVV